jgi:hypothetical protein
VTITCDLCGGRMEEPGALVFGPPDAEERCEKFHVCYSCWCARGFTGLFR